MTDLNIQTAWAERITAAWRSSLEGIFEAGRLLAEAKAALAHGDFAHMIESELPFKPRTAQQLMAIAANERLANAIHGSHLPPHWRTLYYLTKLDDETFNSAIASGTINPEMQRNDALRLKNGGWVPEPISGDTCTTEDLHSLVAANRRFGAILADPPWTFKVYSGKGKARSAERHYETMTHNEIKGLSETINNLAAEDCALFLWAVMPQLPEAIEIMTSWGFMYKTCGFCWVKQNESGSGFSVGMGYWTRANAELCLFGTRGKPQRQYKDVQQLIVHPLMEHSRKPGIVHDRIERLVGGPYLELFGRRITPGWTVWGNNIERRLFDGTVKEINAVV